LRPKNIGFAEKTCVVSVFQNIDLGNLTPSNIDALRILGTEACSSQEKKLQPVFPVGAFLFEGIQAFEPIAMLIWTHRL